MVSKHDAIMEQSTIMMISPFPSNLLKLDDGNYFAWKSQVLPILKGHKFMKFIEFSSFEDWIKNDHPNSSSSGSLSVKNIKNFDQEKEKWYIQDQFLVGWLKGTLCYSISGHFVGKDTTFQLWNAIENRYAAKSHNRVLHYRKLCQNAKKGNLKIDEYILKMKDLVNNLVAAGDEATEIDLIVYVLGGLGSEFEHVSTILGIKSEQCTIKEVQNHLLAFKSKLEQMNSSVTFDLSNSSAHFASEQYDHSGRNTAQLNFPSQQVNSRYNACNIDDSYRVLGYGGHGSTRINHFSGDNIPSELGFSQRSNVFLANMTQRANVHPIDINFVNYGTDRSHVFSRGYNVQRPYDSYSTGQHYNRQTNFRGRGRGGRGHVQCQICQIPGHLLLSYWISHQKCCQSIYRSQKCCQQYSNSSNGQYVFYSNNFGFSQVHNAVVPYNQVLGSQDSGYTNNGFNICTAAIPQVGNNYATGALSGSNLGSQ
nr:uncharacterized protein LOC125423110 [Ziziphus jujuba var. spinosa]